jgi:hypothetical protein
MNGSFALGVRRGRMPSFTRWVSLAFVLGATACNGPPPAPAKPPTPPAEVKVAPAPTTNGIVLDNAAQPTTEAKKKSEADVVRGFIHEAGREGPREAPRAETIDAIRRAPQRAVVRVHSSIEECSGLGGAHVFLEIVRIGQAPASGIARLGGHGAFLPIAERRDGKADPRFAMGRFWVVGIEPIRPAQAVLNPGWCLHGAPPINAQVHAAWPVDDEQAGRDLVNSL